MGHSLGKNVGASLAVRAANLSAPIAGAAATPTGDAIDLLGLGFRPNSVTAIVNATANLDSGDTLTVTGIKLQSSVDSAFTTPVDQVVGANVTLTGASGASNVQYSGTSKLDLDLGLLPTSHRYIRLTDTQTLSDTTNTNGCVTGLFVFGAADEAPPV